jgi:two-component system, cell cycle response regulator
MGDKRRDDVHELVPLSDRYLWLLWCRAAYVGVLTAMASLVAGFDLSSTFLLGCVGWLAVTVAGLSLLRVSRRAAVVAFGVGLLGDAALLGAASRHDGGPFGQVVYLTILHATATTLLASYRTGARVAAAHSVIAIAVADATASGWLGAVQPMPVTRLCVFLAALWLTVAMTASFSAVNERELRRRRYDSEALRRFGLTLAPQHAPVEVAQLLAGFCCRELLAERVAVLVYPTEPIIDDFAVVAVAEQTRLAVAPAMDAALVDLIGNAAVRPVVLRGRLDPERDAAIGKVLPDAANLVLVPLLLDQVRGLLAIEHPRRSSQRGSARVERRMVATAEQAASNASMALGRALVTERLRRAAETDGLTNVANRRTFDAAIARAAQSAVDTGEPYAVVLVDLDHFKRVNDEHGHQVGDDVLRATGAVLRQLCNGVGMPARYGGEEFVVLLPGFDVPGAAEIAEQIRVAVQHADTPVPVSASLGVAGVPSDAESPTQVIKAADAALYRAKAGGRNRVCAAGDLGTQRPAVAV